MAKTTISKFLNIDSSELTEISYSNLLTRDLPNLGKLMSNIDFAVSNIKDSESADELSDVVGLLEDIKWEDDLILNVADLGDKFESALHFIECWETYAEENLSPIQKYEFEKIHIMETLADK